jgi:hypothetical protein
MPDAGQVPGCWGEDAGREPECWGENAGREPGCSVCSSPGLQGGRSKQRKGQRRTAFSKTWKGSLGLKVVAEVIRATPTLADQIAKIYNFGGLYQFILDSDYPRNSRREERARRRNVLGALMVTREYVISSFAFGMWGYSLRGI